MSSQRRIDSSRANRAKSRGPVITEGCARSRAAGLTAGQLLLDGESKEEFNALREEYLAEYLPEPAPGSTSSTNWFPPAGASTASQPAKLPPEPSSSTRPSVTASAPNGQKRTHRAGSLC